MQLHKKTPKNSVNIPRKWLLLHITFIQLYRINK